MNIKYPGWVRDKNVRWTEPTRRGFGNDLRGTLRKRNATPRTFCFFRPWEIYVSAKDWQLRSKSKRNKEHTSMNAGDNERERRVSKNFFWGWKEGIDWKNRDSSILNYRERMRIVLACP